MFYFSLLVVGDCKITMKIEEFQGGDIPNDLSPAQKEHSLSYIRLQVINRAVFPVYLIEQTAFRLPNYFTSAAANFLKLFLFLQILFFSFSFLPAFENRCWLNPKLYEDDDAVLIFFFFLEKASF